MTPAEIKNRLLNRLWSAYNGGRTSWSLEDLVRESAASDLGSLDRRSVAEAMRALEKEGHLRLLPDGTVSVAKPGLGEFIGRLARQEWAKHDLSSALVSAFFEFLDHGDHGWSREDLSALLKALGFPEDPERTEIQAVLTSLERRGLIRLLDRPHRFLDVTDQKPGLQKYAEAGVPKVGLSRDQLKKMLLAGFHRFLDDGTRVWSREAVRNALRGHAANDDPESPENLAVLLELEREGFIALHRANERFLEVLSQGPEGRT